MYKKYYEDILRSWPIDIKKPLCQQSSDRQSLQYERVMGWQNLLCRIFTANLFPSSPLKSEWKVGCTEDAWGIADIAMASHRYRYEPIKVIMIYGVELFRPWSTSALGNKFLREPSTTYFNTTSRTYIERTLNSFINNVLITKPT